MAKRRGNPNWGKPEPIGPIVPTITEFEQVVREYKLTPDQYLRSTRLREWARRNKNSKVHPRAATRSLGLRNRIHSVIPSVKDSSRVADKRPFCFLGLRYLKNSVIPTGASASEGRGSGVEEPAFSGRSSPVAQRFSLHLCLDRTRLAREGRAQCSTSSKSRSPNSSQSWPP